MTRCVSDCNHNRDCDSVTVLVTVTETGSNSNCESNQSFHACTWKMEIGPSRNLNNIIPLTLSLLTTTIVAPPSNASKWQMGFNSAFKGLMPLIPFLFTTVKTSNLIKVPFFHEVLTEPAFCNLPVHALKAVVTTYTTFHNVRGSGYYEHHQL